MKVYVVFEDTGYPHGSHNVLGIFLQEKDAEDMRKACKSSEAYYEVHELIE